MMKLHLEGVFLYIVVVSTYKVAYPDMISADISTIGKIKTIAEPRMPGLESTVTVPRIQ